MTELLGKAFREELSRHAVELINRLATILRNAEVHDPNNQTWKALIQGLIAQIQPLLTREKMAILEVRAGQFSMNKNLIKAGFADFGTFKFLAEEMGKAGVGAIEFRGIPDELSLKRFAYTFAKFTGLETPDFEGLQRELNAGQVKKILITAAEITGAEAKTHSDPREYGVYTFLKGVSAVHEIMEGLRTGRSVGFKRAKRFVQSAVDLLAVDRGLVMALTTIKNHDDYLYNHSVNVCLLSMMVGAKLGFDKARLGELGLAALLRDVGKALVPKELLDKKGKLTPDEWQQMRGFPYTAVMGLLRFRGFNEGALRQVIVAFEHKFKEAHGVEAAPRDFNLFSRIAQLADAYDAMTTPRPYRPHPLPPDEALRNLIIDRHLTKADPALIKTFIHSIGLYPVGSVLILDTNEIAIVAAPPFDMASLARPRVRLIADPAGREIPFAPLVDLTDFDDAGQRYSRSISRTIDRWKYGINVARHLLSDDPAPAK